MPVPSSPFEAAFDAPVAHWIVPFVSGVSDACREGLQQLKATGRLTHLHALLGRLTETRRFEGDEMALSMPHERVLAAELGWPDVDGKMPWSACWARHDGLTLDGTLGWGLMTPGHWLLGRDHLTLLDPDALDLTQAESRGVFETVRELFESDGWQLLWGAPQRWYAGHASLADMPTASLDRVVGRNPDVWLVDAGRSGPVRRLQSEVQMVLYQHAVNEEREARGLPTVNSFWLSGCGVPPGNTHLPDTTRLVPDLRPALLAEDTAGWLAAWERLDGTVLKQALDAINRGQAVRVSLCGERHAVTLSSAAKDAAGGGLMGGLMGGFTGAIRRLAGRASGPDPVALLASL